MPSSAREFLSLIQKNIHFEYHLGASTWVTHPFSTGWHVWPNLVVAQLEFEAVVERSEKEPARVHAGETFTVGPGVMQCITMVNEPAGFSHWSHIQCEVFHGVSLFDLIEPPLVVDGQRSLQIGRINQEMAEIHKAAPSLALILRGQALGWELVTTLLEKVPFKEERTNLIRNASRLTPVLAYIEQNLAKPINNDVLARIAGLSTSRFYVLFRSALGTAPYEYVQRLRLKKAQQLLIRTDRSVAQIGQDVGHHDPYHFSRIFRRYLGTSPAGYRKQMILQTS